MTGTKTRQIKSCIIDDDFIHQFGMRRMIQRYEPTSSIIEFSNGLEAINFFKTPHETDDLPELIFLDINMPVMNGWEFMEEFTQIRDGLKKKVEVYILSSSTDSHDIKKAKANPGITDYIIKPLSPELLKNIFSLEKEKA